MKTNNNRKQVNHNQPYTENNSPVKSIHESNGNIIRYQLKKPGTTAKVLSSFGLFLSSLLILISLNVNAQSNLSFNGYVKYLGMYYHPKNQIPGIDANYLSSQLIHNRFNFKWYATSNLTATLEIRNRLFLGQIVKKFPGYKDFVNVDNGYFNLSKVLITTDNWFLHSAIDRVSLEYYSGNFLVKAGRQRVNWGVNLVWNPNDIFNTFSYFDFDYEERPGTDAVKFQYYTGVTSSAQLVYKAGKDANHMALAGMYRFSKWNYDFQFLGGWVGTDYVAGGGWSGDIKGGGFRGEFSYFTPRQENNGSYGALSASVAGDFTFKNSLYLHTAFLFNSHGTTGPAGGNRSFFDMNLSAKNLSYARYSIFGQASYPFTPLISGDFSGIVNPCDGSLFLGPSLTWSLGNNLELMATGQIFLGKSGTEFGELGQAAYGRLKWAF